MNCARLTLAFLILRASTLWAQGELAPSVDNGPLQASSGPSDRDQGPKPDRDGVYTLGAGITQPTLLSAPESVGAENIPDCDPPVVVVSAVIGDDGRASVRQYFTSRSSPCASLAEQVLKQSRFQTARIHHLPVAVHVCISISFRPDQLSVPVFTKCPRNADARDEDRAQSLGADVQPSSDQGVAQTISGPMDLKSAKPMPDERGVYLLGPGIVSPRWKERAEAGPPESTATCQHPVLFSGVVNVDGSIEVRGVYQLASAEDKTCDKLAQFAVEKSTAQPATLDGVPVPVRVCVGVPFGRPMPPIVRGTVCPRNLGAKPLEVAGAIVRSSSTKPPVVISGASDPEYTFEARKKNIEGTVTLSLIVTEEGLPTDIHVTTKLGYGLDEIALDLVRRYRFSPALADGRPVAARTNIDVLFKLKRD